jgi:hypothetical protein
VRDSFAACTLFPAGPGRSSGPFRDTFHKRLVGALIRRIATRAMASFATLPKTGALRLHIIGREVWLHHLPFARNTARNKTYQAFPPGERTMRKLLILSVLSLMTASTTGCLHNCCGPSMGGGLFAKRPQPAPTQCCRPCCPPPPCCDPCGGETAMPMTQMMPTVPCCQ